MLAARSRSDVPPPRPAPGAEDPLSDHANEVRRIFREHALAHGGRYHGRDGKRPHSRWHGRMLGLALRELRGAGTRMLDAGAGNGDFSRTIAETTGADVVAFDFVTEAIALARATAPAAGALRLAAADVRALPFPAAAFDATVCMGVLSLLAAEDQPRAIQELARVTRSVLLLGIHDASSAYFRWVHSGLVEGVPLRPTTVARVREAAGVAGLALTRVHRVFLLPFLSPLALLRLERAADRAGA